MTRLPAQWEDQEFIQLVFPHENTDWNEYLDDAINTFINIAKTIAKYQKCLIIAKNLRKTKSYFEDFEHNNNLTFIRIDSNDTWSRDFGGITVQNEDKFTVLDFKFNAWGNKFDSKLDNQITSKLKLKGMLKEYSHQSIPLVLEGGSIDSDGNGTILTTSKCLLEKNRNPTLSKTALEKQLKNTLGASKILWLNYGELIGDDTDAHIDTLARFVDKNTIVYQSCDDTKDEQYDELKKMKEELQTFTNAYNEHYNLIALPSIQAKYENDERLPATYANFLIINGAILVPTYNDKNDNKALSIFKNIFPTRDVIAIDCTTLIKQHGSLHCVTMQYPKINKEKDNTSILKTALIQQKYYSSKEETIKNTVFKIEEASKNGASLVVLQELHQTHYFCQNENVDTFDLASSWQDDLKFWSNIALENNIVLVTSLFEKRAAGLYHNTAVVFEKDGSIAGKYRKMHIPDDPGFYEKFYFTPGDFINQDGTSCGFEPIQTSVGKLGVLICWDQWYPEAARLMCLKGADILIYPTAIGWFEDDSKEEQQKQLDAWITVQRGHSIANNIPIITANRVGFERDDSNVLKGTNFWGNSFILGAQGEFLAHASHQKEQILYATIDFKNTENVRRWWPFLRDRRIECYNDITKRYID